MSRRRNFRPTFYSRYLEHRNKVNREMGDSVLLPVWCFEEGSSRKPPRPSFEAVPPYICGDEMDPTNPAQVLALRETRWRLPAPVLHVHSGAILQQERYKFVRSSDSCGVQWVPAIGVGHIDIGSHFLSTAVYTHTLNGPSPDYA